MARWAIFWSIEFMYLGSKALEKNFLLALIELFRVVAVETVECPEEAAEEARREEVAVVVAGVLGARGRASMLAILIDWRWFGFLVGGQVKSSQVK